MLTCITFICTITGKTFDIVKVLYEDYCIFLLDVMNKGKHVVSVIVSVVGWLISTVYSWSEVAKNICLGIYEFILLTVKAVCTVVMKAIHFILCVPEVLKNVITLVGSGIWLALKLIPLAFVYFISMCVFLVGRGCEEIMTVAECICKGTFDLVNGIIQFLRDIPFEAQAGLILGACILYASLKYHTHIRQCFANLFVQMKYVLHYAWSGLTIPLLSIFTNPNDELETIEPLESEESSDETENDQAHESLHNSMLNLRSRHVPRVEPGKNTTRQHLLHQLQQEQENKLCVVCQDRSKCVIILPCRHLCLCTVCCIIIQREHRICPVCRQDVRRTMKVYT